MFDQLVVSSQQRRKHTAAKYFFGTGALYVFAIACAFAVSVLMSEPKLADTAKVLTLISPPLPPVLGDSRRRMERRPTQPPERPNLYAVRRLEDLLSRRPTAPPMIASFDRSGDDTDVGYPVGAGYGSRVGVPDGYATAEPEPRPEPPQPRAAAQTPPVLDNRPMRVPSSVLQGKAVERRKPVYPPLAQQIRLQGDVSVEVIIAPDGHVESARVVSGHPMLAQCAVQAATGWRFQPTLLNNVPVRVTGVITFVFKLSE